MYFQANYETSWEIISQCSRLYDLAETPSLRCAVLSTLSSQLSSPLMLVYKCLQILR